MKDFWYFSDPKNRELYIEGYVDAIMDWKEWLQHDLVPDEK